MCESTAETTPCASASQCDNLWDHKTFQRVGQGNQTSYKCQTLIGYKACLNVDLHNKVSLDGQNHAGNVYIKKVIHSCDKPECPLCFKRGWAVREADNVEDRIIYAQKKFGIAEHIVCSVPITDYGLSYEKLKIKALKALETRGVIGGVLIFHLERYCNKEEAIKKGKLNGWYISPHFHIIGFIDGGYAKCRECHKKIAGCSPTCTGFDRRSRNQYFKEGGKEGAGNSGSGWIVDVKGKRRTIHGTAWYQLNHCTLVRKKVRAQVTTWFGVCSYHKLKLRKEDRIRRDVCPICQHELEDVSYVGDDNYIVRSAVAFKEWEEPYRDKDGCVKWIPKPKCLNERRTNAEEERISGNW